MYRFVFLSLLLLLGCGCGNKTNEVDGSRIDSSSVSRDAGSQIDSRSVSRDTGSQMDSSSVSRDTGSQTDGGDGSGESDGSTVHSEQTVVLNGPQTLLDKIRGGWVGKAYGVSFGGPTEFLFQGVIIQQPLQFNPLGLWYLSGQDDMSEASSKPEPCPPILGAGAQLRAYLYRTGPLS